MSEYVEIYLPDLLLNEGEVEYFEKHSEDFKKLNNREFIIVPFEVYLQIRDKVIVVSRSFFDVLPTEVSEEKVEQEVLLSEQEPVLEEVSDDLDQVEKSQKSTHNVSHSKKVRTKKVEL